ncbi:hypothetical protein [Nitrosovibrio sp. Nv4]|uniref:hypothetical protein n=1 Tax=Nitrosovibrio sp. Nv4 TaxID=1945880 RepID=UPI000BE3B2A1|nr:hypothetical protein [Nitrosovibrio sp. Nv4]
MRRFITAGPKVGVCNICGEEGPLTEDHTPPKGAVRVTQVEMRHIKSLLSAEETGEKARVSQNGVKFRTLCKRCNNSLLGANYDIAFNDFCQKIASYLKSPLVLPEILHITGKPQKIVRSVLGHLCAMGVNRYKKGPNTEDLRNYLIDQTETFPDYLDVYYWVYPYQTQVLFRDAAMTILSLGHPASVWLMKFFPVAFFVIWDKPHGYQYPQFPNMATWGHLGIDDDIELPVHLNVVPHERWPEAPDDGRILVYGQQAMGVHEKAKKNNKLPGAK